MIKKVVLGVVALFLLLQLVPYGRDHTNPPVRLEPAWDSPQTRELAVRACYDCHSNETRWLWFHNIAPISWGVQADVMQGRERLNFSEWDDRQSKSDDSAEVVAEGEMPPLRYVLAHPEANLSEAEREALIRGLLATFGGDLEGEEEEAEEPEQDGDNSGPGGGDRDSSGNSGPGSDHSGPGGGDDEE